MNFKKTVLCAAAAVIVTVCLTLNAAAQQGVINTIVGGGPSNMPATDANLNSPTALAFDAQGNYYIAATGGNQVFKVNPGTGTLTLVAGNGISGSSGDGGPAVNAEFAAIYGLAVDGANPANVYIGDVSDCMIRVVNQSTGIITSLSAPLTCSGGDGGPANLAGFQPLAMALNPLTNDLYVADFGGGAFNKIRKIAGGVPTGTVSTVAGSNVLQCQGTAPYGDGGSATGPNVAFCFQYSGVSAGLALDTSVTPANILISDGGHCVVREVIGGKIFRVAGSYSLGCGFKDSSTATSGQLTDPTQLQVQVSGATQTVTVADTFNYVIRKFTVTISGGTPTSGAISTIAGTPQSAGFGGDGGLATLALLDLPQGVAIDASGDLFIGDSSNQRVREVDHTTQNINTVGGYSLSNTTFGEVSFDNPVNNPNIPGLDVALFDPAGVYVNPTTNNVLIAAPSENVVHEFSSGTAVVNTVAGNGVAGFAGDGNPGNDPGTELSFPNGAVQDSNGNTYIADTSNCVIRIVNPAGVINDFAGGSAGVQNGCGYSGDGGPATAAQLNSPNGLAVDSSNNLYIADTSNEVIREVNASTGNITTIAGNNTLGGGYSGDGGLATNAMLNNPVGVAVDGANPANVYIADESNQRIRRVDGVTHVITTVAGNGANAFSGDGLATQNSVSNPQGVASDVNGNIFISDTNNYILRWVDSGGTMLTFAGMHNAPGFSGDGGPATAAELYTPIGLSVDASGNIYFADQTNNRIRKVNAFAGIGRSTGSLNFGLEAVGTPTANAQEVILSAIGPTTINSITTSGDFSEVDDCPNSLTAGATCAVDVFFSPTASGERAGLLTINDNGLLSQTQTVSLQGEGAALSITGTLAFGSVPLNTSSTKSVTLTNAGSTSVTISGITLTQTTDYAFAATNTCPLTGGALASKAKCTIAVTFTPHNTGVKKGALVVKSNDPSSPLLLGYSGTGSSFESFTPATVTFATTVLNTNSKAAKVTFKYSGSSTLTLTSLTASASYSLNVTGITSGACNLSGNTTLTAGQSCAFNVVFKPTAIGPTPGTVTASFTGDPNNSTLVLPLTGVGTEVTFTPASLSFGNVLHGTTKSLNLTVKNVSASNTLNVSGTSFTGTYASVYSVTNNTCGSVGPGLTCTLTVQYAPTAVGTLQKAVLNVTDNGGGSPQLVNVTGNGT